MNEPNQFVIKLFGSVIFTLVLFAVFFDPTEAAFGAQFIELPDFMLVLAQGIGAAAWLLGVLYMLIASLTIWMIFNTDKFLAAMIVKNKISSLKTIYRRKWYEVPFLIIFVIASLIAIISGFWFTGFFWFLAIITLRILLIKMRNTKEYKEWIEENK